MFKWKEKESEKSKECLVKVSVPFEKPASIKAPGPIEVEDDEREKYLAVLKHFQDPKLQVRIKETPKVDTEKRPLSDNEKFWLTRECLLRYLRATKWDVDDAIKRLETTIAWRREYGIAEDPEHNRVTAALVEPENASGKQVILGYDNDARPILYLKNGRQNTRTSPRQVQQLVYQLESVVTFMPQGQEKIAILIDFKHYKVEGTTSKIPSISVGKEVLHILQTHYPERLGKGVLINMPFVAQTFLRLIWPFIDPTTKEKIHFDTPPTELIPLDQLDKDYGGHLDFTYDHKVYWKAQVEFFEKRRAHEFAKWEKLGGVVGISEYDLKSDTEEIKCRVGN